MEVMEEEPVFSPITLLPTEIITMILQMSSCTDIINFGSTCSYFREIVNENQYLWKEKFKGVLPPDIFNIVEEHGDGNWLKELKRYYTVKQQVFLEIMSMSPKYYWRTKEIVLEDVRNFFLLALDHNMNYYYVVSVLQDIIKRGNKLVDQYCGEKPFTMTEIYYSKIVLRYLIQTFLTVKWVRATMKKELSPEAVLNFFMQWADSNNMHSEEELEEALDVIVGLVEQQFPDDKAQPHLPIQEKLMKGLITEKDVLTAITEVIYRQGRLVLMPSANLDTLNLVKVIKSKCGHPIAAAALYHAVAGRCGIRCHMVAFPNHLFLEWRNPKWAPPYAYKIDLESGMLCPKGRCPYSRGMNEYKYCHDSLLHYIISSFLMTMGALKSWASHNAVLLLEFLSANTNSDNPYKNFLGYLRDRDAALGLDAPINMKYMDQAHINIIHSLITLNPGPTPVCREMSVVPHDPGVRFGVGMICYHKKYDYLCVIRAWDLTCSADWRRRTEFKTLRLGSEQPFYSVIAVDQSDRYVAQENLVDVSRPSRLYHLEDVIAKEFTHYDGYCYIPNYEKQKEFPEDGAVREMYRIRCAQRALQIRMPEN